MNANTETCKLKRKRKPWCVEGDLLLLEFWMQHIEELRGPKKNGHIYRKISAQLAEHDYHHTAREVQIKIQNFSSRFRKEKSGSSPSTWPYYHQVNNIIGSVQENNIKKSFLENIEEDAQSSVEATSVVTSPDSPEDALLDSLLATGASPSYAFANMSSNISALPVLSKSSTEAARAKRKKLSFFQREILSNFQKTDEKINNRIQEINSTDRELIAIQKANLEVNRERNEMIKKFVSDFGELKNTITEYMKNSNK